MKSSFICEKCSSTTYEQFTQTQVRCLHCGAVNMFDTGYKVVPEFQLYNENDILKIEVKSQQINAPLIKRVLNYLLDSMFIAFLFILISSIFNIDILKIDRITLQVYSVLSLSVYYIIMEFFFNKTIGKTITKTRVISTSGNKLTFMQCVLRALCRIIPIDFLSGFLFSGSFWHDSIPKTMVVEDK